MKEIKTLLGERSYSIFVGTDILDQIGEKLKPLQLGSRVAVVTNSLVLPLYGERVRDALERSGYRVTVIEIPDGEVYKSLASAEKLYDELIRFELDRTSTVLALGGGVIGDLAGFVAATYMRGIHFVNVPTTLLAHVDSAIGGKTGVDHSRGKNLIGAFYQPRLVLCDLKVLQTLPEREMLAGMAEVVKYGVILDADFFSFVESRIPAILQHDSQSMMEVVCRSCAAKVSIVEEDERESGRRAILNFGHTLGHAIESLTGYTQYIHGEAVSMGMVAAARISLAMGLCEDELVVRLERLLKAIGLPTAVPEVNPEDVIQALSHDKKVKDGRVRFVLPDRIGNVVIRDDVDPQIIRGTFGSP